MGGPGAVGGLRGFVATTFGWPLLCAGALKLTHDPLLLALFDKAEAQLPLEA